MDPPRGDASFVSMSGRTSEHGCRRRFPSGVNRVEVAAEVRSAV